jgi:hypothetical protein
MQRMIKGNGNGNGNGPGYVQQVMDISLQDAMALHGELAR